MSAEVTAWPERLALTAIVVGVIVLTVGGMWWGWRRRARRQEAQLPALPEVPDHPGVVQATAEGRYVGTVRAPDWLDRVVARGLGAPGRATVSVTSEGILIDRVGAPALYLPAAVLVGVESGRGLAGTVVEAEGMTIFGWSWGGLRLDTAFRAPDAAAQHAVADAAAALVADASTHSVETGDATAVGRDGERG